MTVKSWLKTKTSRPSILPCPVTTPSPRKTGSPPRAPPLPALQCVEFFKGAFIQQEIDPFPCGEFPQAVLYLDPGGAAPLERLLLEFLQPLQIVFHR